MNKRRMMLCLFGLAGILSVRHLQAFQFLQTDPPITWAAKDPVPKKPLTANSVFQVALTAKIAPGWHLYSTSQPEGGPIPTRIWIPEGSSFLSAGDIQIPLPHKFFDKNFEMEVEYYEGSPVFLLPVKVGPKVAGGKHALTIQARYQACSNQVCLPPRTEKIQITIEVSGKK